jgi:uncharacterized protein (DUF1697 family)
MGTWIAFFRGVNVGGNTLPMKQLATALEDVGFTDVRTYIQSGNVLFTCPKATAPQLVKRISDCVAKRFDFQPRVLVLSSNELAQAAAANPFPQADQNPKSLHLFFLAKTPPSPDIEGLHRIKAKTEEFELRGKAFYLLTPAGFGVSKLAERAERLLGVDATARNWRTVRTVLEMAAAKGSKPRTRQASLAASKPRTRQASRHGRQVRTNQEAASRAASASKPHGK